MSWALRFHGVGNAAAVELGSAMATIERDAQPWLTIDCGAEGLSAYLAHYGEAPRALFITHTHLDHIGGFERLFIDAFFDPARRGRTRIYVPARVVPLLHQRVGDYPNVLAEGGANFWDAFRSSRSGMPSGTTACAWKCSKPATTGRRPATVCACAAASS